MAKLTEEQFRFFKEQVTQDKIFHDNMLGAINAPEDIIAAYQGRFLSGVEGGGEGHGGGLGRTDTSESSIIENWLFISISTIMPNLFFQLPRIIIKAKRRELDFSAAVLNALANIYFTDDIRRENQLAILDAFMAYGYGVVKNGYNTKTEHKSNKPSIFTGETKADGTENMEGDVEFLKFEKPIILRQSPSKTYLDKTQPFGKGNRVTFEYDRTLKEIVDSKLYNLSQNFIDHFKARSTNPNELDVDLKLFEHWRMKDGFAHKLVYIEEWDEPLTKGLQKTVYDEIPISYLRFNDMGDLIYTVSHGRLATDAQKELNYLNELWKAHIDNIRNQHLINMDALSESGQRTLRENQIGGVVETSRPITPGDATPLVSQTMDPNLFNNIANTRGYLNLLLSTAGPKGGEPSEKLATSERQKALGDALRSAGLQDSIRVFVSNEVKQLIKNVLRLASPEVVISLTGKNLILPQTGQVIEPGQELEIGGENGFDLDELISGDIDVDYVFDVDIVSASKPDFPVIRKQMVEAITMAKQLQPDLAGEGKKFNATKALQLLFSTFDQVPDATQLIEDMSPEEQMALAQAQQQEQTTEQLKATTNPTEMAIATQANNIQTRTEGLQ